MTLLFVRQPDRDGQHVKRLRDQLHRLPAQADFISHRHGALGESAPNLPVIVERPVKMTADESPGVQPQAGGSKHAGQGHEQKQNHEGLERKTRISSQPGDKVGQHAHHDKIQARDEDRERAKDDCLRGINIRTEHARPKNRDSHQNARQKERSRIERFQRRVERRIENRLAARIDSN